VLINSDLSITKTDSPDPVTAGNNLIYTVTVTNGGLDTATGVTLTDTLPLDVIFASATTSQGSCSGTSTVICNLGNLTNGATATVTIVVTPTVAGDITNTADVISNETDPNMDNNTDSVSTIAIAKCGELIATIVGTPGDDIVNGTAGPDVINGLDGNDTISGLDGDDVICGGLGGDILFGNLGNDTLIGNEGSDTLRGGRDNDTLRGSKGNDTLQGESGNDTLQGEIGDDTLDGGTETDTCDGGTHVVGDTAINCETVTNVP
jgi:uncharacterized repeat protein (TIGR01451 family)